MQTQTTLQKSTSKGQITLPISWRSRFNTDQFLLRMFRDKLEVKPINMDKLPEYVSIFNAFRDNGGKGIKAKEVLRVLRKINAQD